MITQSDPGLADLPAPPEGKTGWPWVEDGPVSQPESPPPGGWPRITVVTPSYNQAEFLEETLRSVLLQGYPNLEYIVIDGGSTDASADILRRYDEVLSYWCSEPDRGQTHAINKGFARSTGDIMAWLNSDDSYYPGALFTAARELARSDHDLLFGRMDKVDASDNGRVVRTSSPHEGVPFHRFRLLPDGRGTEFHFYQPAMFWKRSLWEAAGQLGEAYEYGMDREWCSRALGAGASVCTTDQILARFTLHPDSKTVALRHLQLKDEVRLYLDLARRPEFRAVPCLLSTLRPAQGLLYLKAKEAALDGRRATAAVYKTGGRIIKASRTWVPGLKGKTTVEADSDLARREALGHSSAEGAE